MMNTSVPSVVTRDPALARRLAVMLVEEVGAEQLEIAATDAGLSLSGALGSGRATFVLDYGRGSLRRRVLEAPAAPVVKALGKASRGVVVDATAGLLRDTLTVARVAARVAAVERHPVVAALAADALDRLSSDDRLAQAASRVTLHTAEAAVVLAALDDIDGVVLDPMFEAPTRGAPKKELQLLQRLHEAGDDDDAADVLGLARTKAAVVVVKRSARAAPLAEGVHHAVAGKGFRWDVYRR
jgi:16S rRNA (guanine1516-N2)-methyltransferase